LQADGVAQRKTVDDSPLVAGASEKTAARNTQKRYNNPKVRFDRMKLREANNKVADTSEKEPSGGSQLAVSRSRV
jgi:hypothetical protein